MKIAIGNDHTGLALKRAITEMLVGLGHQVQDMGTDTDTSVDYPVYGARAARAVVSGECALGIVICGTGVGIGISANKVKGVRCAICSEVCSAVLSRQHNDANMLALGSRVVAPEYAQMIVRAFVESAFDGGRHVRRVGQMHALEEGGQLE